MNIAHIEPQSFIYGPGCRFVIWTQGCAIHCKGCWNTGMWDFTPKHEIQVSEIHEQILQYRNEIEGITLLGGEPLDQYEETLSLLTLCVKSGLSAMLFTGYEMHEIEEKGLTAITKNLDILITGPYEKSNRTLYHQWIGSTNQRIHFLTTRYAGYKIKNKNYTELTLNEDGSITILGFPDKNTGPLNFDMTDF
jgi:anaerobic ribonucleoside-triphosphate reductase activating protein